LSTVFGELDPAGAFIQVTCTSQDSRDRDQCAAVLRSLTPAVNPTVHPEVYALPLSWAACTQLAFRFPGEPAWDGRPGLTWAPGAALSEWIFTEILRRSCEGDFTGQPPARDPMKHQRAGAVAVGMNGRFIFCDDMGTGKSQTYLMSLAELEARGRSPWPALLVTPAGVIDTVLEEVPQIYPGWKAVAYRGSGRERYLKSNAQLLVMGYETMRNDTGDSRKPGPLMKFRAGTLIGDEIHALCNYGSLQSREFRKLAKTVQNVFAGSGTPITANAAGFWPVLNGLYPASYPDRGRFKTMFFLSRGKAAYGNGDAEITGLDPAREKQFRTEMQGVFRRVAKADVLDLPPKTYSRRYVEIPAAWRAAYDQMEADMLAELPDQLTPLEARIAVVKMMRLRQLACSACDVTVTREIEQKLRSPNYGQEVEHVSVTLKEPCWKGAELVDILRELHEAEGNFDDRGGQHGHVTGSRPVITFAESAQLTRLSGLMAEKKGYAVGYFDGSVKDAERSEVRHAFQGNKLDLLCVTTGAGGAGLNLTAADTVVFVAPPWGYVPRAQAEDRSHRLGQTRPVQVIDIIAKDSVESRVLARLREKAGNLAELVADRRIVESFLGGGGH
jgi:SNF2 family DNA or RNA helicase